MEVPLRGRGCLVTRRFVHRYSHVNGDVVALRGRLIRLIPAFVRRVAVIEPGNLWLQIDLLDGIGLVNREVLHHELA